MNQNTFSKFGVSIQEGSVVFKENDIAEKMYFILEGTVEIFITTKNAQKLVATLEKGDIFGEMSMVDGKPRSATAVAKSNINALALNQQQMEVMIKNNTDFGLKMIRLLSKKLRDSNNQILELTIKDRHKQIVYALMNYAKDFGNKGFKGYRLNISDFIETANSRLGMDKQDIKDEINDLLKANYIAYGAQGSDDIVLLEKLTKTLPSDMR